MRPGVAVVRSFLPCLLFVACSEYDVMGDKTPGMGTNTTSGGTGATNTQGTTGTDTETDPYGTGTGTGTGTGGTDTTTTPGGGHGGQGWTDQVVLPTTSYVDVLWVVDNSSSMGDNQDALATEFPTFIDFFDQVEGIDYHIGVVSTDMEDPGHQGKLRETRGIRWIDPQTPDPHGVFAEMSLMGTEGSGDEAGRAPVYFALTEELGTWNAGFVRQDATLDVIVVSDEDDMSSQFGVDIAPFVAFMRGFKGDASKVSFSTIVGDVPGGCPTAEPGIGYPEVQSALGGQFHSICSPDWDTVLRDLAADALGTRTEFFLTEIPEEQTIEVVIEEADGTTVRLTELGVEFDYDPARNSVTLLTYTPGPSATVTVEYEVDRGAMP